MPRSLKRLSAKMNRAFWLVTRKAIDDRRSAHHVSYADLSEDLFQICESLERGEPVDAPFPKNVPAHGACVVCPVFLYAVDGVK